MRPHFNKTTNMSPSFEAPQNIDKSDKLEQLLKRFELLQKAS